MPNRSCVRGDERRGSCREREGFRFTHSTCARKFLHMITQGVGTEGCHVSFSPLKRAKDNLTIVDKENILEGEINYKKSITVSCVYIFTI